MNEKKVYNAITRIDDDLIEKSINRKSKKTVSKGVRIRFWAIAACLVLFVAGVVIAAPVLFRSGKNPAINPSSANTLPVSDIKSEKDTDFNLPVSSALGEGSDSEPAKDVSSDTETYTPTTVSITDTSLDGEALAFVNGSSLSVSGGLQGEPRAFEFNVSGLIVKAKFYVVRMLQTSLGKQNPEYTDFKYWNENGWIGKVRPWGQTP